MAQIGECFDWNRKNLKGKPSKTCRQGDNCKFLHVVSENEIRKARPLTDAEFERLDLKNKRRGGSDEHHLKNFVPDEAPERRQTNFRTNKIGFCESDDEEPRDKLAVKDRIACPIAGGTNHRVIRVEVPGTIADAIMETRLNRNNRETIVNSIAICPFNYRLQIQQICSRLFDTEPRVVDPMLRKIEQSMNHLEIKRPELVDLTEGEEEMKTSVSYGNQRDVRIRRSPSVPRTALKRENKVDTQPLKALEQRCSQLEEFISSQAGPKNSFNFIPNSQFDSRSLRTLGSSQSASSSEDPYRRNQTDMNIERCSQRMLEKDSEILEKQQNLERILKEREKRKQETQKNREFFKEQIKAKDEQIREIERLTQAAEENDAESDKDSFLASLDTAVMEIDDMTQSETVGTPTRGKRTRASPKVKATTTKIKKKTRSRSPMRSVSFRDELTSIPTPGRGNRGIEDLDSEPCTPKGTSNGPSCKVDIITQKRWIDKISEMLKGIKTPDDQISELSRFSMEKFRQEWECILIYCIGHPILGTPIDFGSAKKKLDFVIYDQKRIGRVAVHEEEAISILKNLAALLKTSDKEAKTTVDIGLEFNLRFVEKDLENRSMTLRFHFVIFQLILDYLADGNKVSSKMKDLRQVDEEPSSGRLAVE